MFRLTKQDVAEIFASELAGWAVAKPGAGTVAALTLRAIRHLLENTGEYRAPEGVGAPSDEFLNQHPLPLQALYDREKLLRGRLLYVELASFIDLLVDTGAVQIDIAPQPGTFSLAPFSDPATEALRVQGFNRLVEVRKYRHDSDVIRVPRVEKTPTGARLTVQKARYSDQAKSNLILDFVGRGDAPTLRAALGAENPGRLPALDDPRLVNSLGVTILVFYRDENGALTPFLVPRTRKTAVLNRGLWSDSASGAAEWPTDPERTPGTFEAYILDDLHQELKSEIGLEVDDLTAILPLAIGREIMRAGKPQMFFIGFTGLRRGELLERMEKARQANLKNPIEPEEIFRMPLLRKAPRGADPRQIHTDYESMLVDPQCAASLYYSMVFLERIGPRLGQFVD
ncbi:MAG: hypothetical protein KDD81_10105 [Rhodobacteraceae bacterium]|uniref:hypothetical protein n=1 Tax=Albidovulum sp. TaxID=1872424 RepID=UPI001D64587E|nr:hypothetical protein [Paracoccaceae bacterium]HPE26766.1 hypothetical protein [Albidovulum sp.]MCB2118892.1 hypothetical protein [Paracoccaceae bacterium]MCB2122913.1 hypothetical protein [Paracoccaceae bacterium]MCB2133529.1 hypothetical protein [Paracoccaceae bacterium]